MSGNTSDVQKSIGSIGQPEDPDLPGLEFLSYPKEDGRRKAVVVFKNDSQLQFREDSDGNLHEETFFASGRTCKSFEVDSEQTPAEQLKQTLADYSTITKDELRTSRPWLWTVLGIQ